MLPFMHHGNFGSNFLPFKVVHLLVDGVNGFAIFKVPTYDMVGSLPFIQLRLGFYEHLWGSRWSLNVVMAIQCVADGSHGYFFCSSRLPALEDAKNCLLSLPSPVDCTSSPNNVSLDPLSTSFMVGCSSSFEVGSCSASNDHER